MSFHIQLFVQTHPNAQRLRDIKPPIEVTPNLLPYAILGIIILAVLVWGIGLNLRKRKSALPSTKEEVVIFHPHEIAHGQLNKLDIDSLDMETYHTQISYIIREYIAARYNVPALELTTFRLLHLLSDKEIEEIYIKHIQDFLVNCDIVKFTKYQPNKTEADARMVDARWFVNETKTLNP